MKIIKNSTIINIKKTCVALGNFDGVHIGHRKIISSAVKYAKELGYLSCVYTFSSHPSEFLGTKKSILTDINEKIEKFNTLDCDIIYLDDFSDIRNYSPEKFCKDILSEKLNAEYVFCGSNYTFGYLGKGNTETLQNELNKLGIKLIIVPFITTDSGDIVSSTMIRSMISQGNINKALQFMCSPYIINGIVMHGKKLGRKLGFPTLNICIPDSKVIPKYGVYVADCIIDGVVYKGISNIGIRPTTDDGTKYQSFVNCETYLFEYNSDAYDKTITVRLYDMIRNEMKFNSVEELKQRIADDVIYAKSYFDKKYNPDFT